MGTPASDFGSDVISDAVNIAVVDLVASRSKAIEHTHHFGVCLVSSGDAVVAAAIEFAIHPVDEFGCLVDRSPLRRFGTRDGEPKDGKYQQCTDHLDA